MAEEFLFCAENLLARHQFPDLTGSAEEAATGHEWWRVATGRRHPSNYWTPTTANSDSYIQALHTVPRALNFCAIDRASNHKGYRYQLLLSNDAFTTSRTVFDVNTIPLVSGGALDGAMGCVTREGAWLRTFAADGAYGMRLLSKAMGSGLLPQLTGVTLGLAWTPTSRVSRLPLQDNAASIQFTESVSAQGYRGRGPLARLQAAEVTFRFTALEGASADELLLDYHLDLYERGNPAWICWRRTSEPWKAMLVAIPTGASVRRIVDESWPLRRQVVLPYLEEQPA